MGESTVNYVCNNCGIDFEFCDGINFCPYCGKSLKKDESASDESGHTGINDTAEAINFIWGERAIIRESFLREISECIENINRYAEKCMLMAYPNRRLSKFDENYEKLKKSGNRKNLIFGMNDFLAHLSSVISSLDDNDPEKIKNRLDDIDIRVQTMKDSLYNLIGLNRQSEERKPSAKEDFPIELAYSKEQLKYFYGLVIDAYSKYKKCVENNNIFAAFASTSNYGMMPSLWRAASMAEDVGNNRAKEGKGRFEDAVGYMSVHNAEEYDGFLDEDFVPHVDAFWHGLKTLCDFIDNRVTFDYNEEDLVEGISDREKQEIGLHISSSEFVISEKLIKEAAALRDAFEELI